MATETREVKFVLSAQDRASAAINGLRSGLGGVQSSVGAVNGAFASFTKVGLVGGAAALTAFIKGVATGADELNDLADATGSTAVSLSAIEDVAARAGVSVTDMGTAMLKFNKTLADSKPGSEQERVFKALGLGVAELRRLDPAEALRRTAAAFNTFADGGEKARFMQELFGKSTRDTAKFIKDLGAQTQLTGTITEQQAAEVRKFNDEIDALAKSGTDAARTLVGYLLPGINSLVDEARVGTEVFGGFWRAVAATGGAGGLGLSNVENLARARERLARQQQTVNDIESGADGGRFSLFGKDRVASAKEEVAALQKYVTYYERLLGITAADLGGELTLAPPGGGGKPKLPDIATLATLAGKSAKTKPGDFIGPELPAALKEAFKAIEDADESKIQRLNSQLEELLSVQRSGSGGVALEQAIGNTRKELAELDPVQRIAAERQRTLNALLGDTPSAEIERLKHQMDLLNTELASATDPERIRKLEELMRILQGRLKEATRTDEEKRAEERLKRLNEQAESVFGETVLRGFRGTTDGILEMWGDMLVRMAAEAASAQLWKYITGGGGVIGLGNNIGGGLGSLFSLFGGFFAEGGTLGAGKWGIAGDRGPEVVRGPATIEPMAGGGTVNHINVTSGVQRHEVLSLLQQAFGALEGRMNQRLLRAGISM